ncbi:hypothetical protein AB0J89_04580 [Micromonospora chokoriensis]
MKVFSIGSANRSSGIEHGLGGRAVHQDDGGFTSIPYIGPAETMFPEQGQDLDCVPATWCRMTPSADGRRRRLYMYRQRGAVLIGVIALLGTFVVAGPMAVARQAAPELTWGACPAEVVMPAPVAVQCAKIPVPLDYRDPDGEQIDIMISKIASTSPAKRRGILLLNPGGPGGIGIDQGAFLVSRGLPTTVSDAYDLIGMDTRGVGHSTKMSCGFTLEDPYWANVPPYAVDDAAVTRQAAIAKQVADKCAASDEDGRLRHITTANTARDLDRVARQDGCVC